MMFVIYKQFGVYHTTTEENYKKTIRNAFDICSWENFNTPEEIIDYLVTYGVGRYSRPQFIVID